MTPQEAVKILKGAIKKPNTKDGYLGQAIDMAIQALEQTNKIEESNFSTEQYEADLRGAYDCGYNCGYADAMNDIAESEDKE